MKKGKVKGTVLPKLKLVYWSEVLVTEGKNSTQWKSSLATLLLWCHPGIEKKRQSNLSLNWLLRGWRVNLSATGTRQNREFLMNLATVSEPIVDILAKNKVFTFSFPVKLDRCAFSLG